jgi:hypothetical protein
MAYIDSGTAIVLVVEILLVLARRHALCYNVFRRLLYASSGLTLVFVIMLFRNIFRVSCMVLT